jgi:hypothetical protein
MILANMKKTALISLALGIVFVAAVALQISDPFGLKFWTPFYGLTFVLVLLLFIATRYLFFNRQVILKLISILPAIFCLLFFLIFIGLVFDYRWILPGYPVKNLTEQEWNEDVQFLETELKKHPAFKDSLTNTFLSDNNLSASANQDERLISLMKYIGRFHDGHTLMHPLQPGLQACYFPLQGFWFDDGYFIVRAAKKYKELVGAQIISVNGKPIEELWKQVSILYGAENEWQRKSQFDLFVFSANVLHGLQVIPDVNHCRIEYKQDGKSFSLDVTSEPFFAWMFWFLKPISENDWNPAYYNMRKPNYSLQYDSAYKGIMVRFNSIQNIPDWSIENMSEKLVDAIKASPNRVIFDLRNNQGGDNTKYNDLLEVIREYSTRTDFIFLVSRKTFSAAVNFISESKSAGKITLVGEPTGAGPNHYGDPHHVLLPNSKLSFFVSTRKWEFDSLDNNKLYIPDIPVKYKSVHLKENIDPWLDAINLNSRLPIE